MKFYEYMLKQKNPFMKSQLWNPQTCSSDLVERQSVPSALVCYSLRFPHDHHCYSDKTESIFSMLRKTAISTHQKPKKEMSHPSFYAINEDTLRHNIAQMTSASKVYIHCLLLL